MAPVVVAMIMARVPARMTMSAVTGSMFPPCIVIAASCVAAPIARFISMEAIERALSTLRKRAAVSVARIPAVINMAPKIARPAVPGARAYKDAIGKPIGPIVAVGRAIVWRIVEVPVGAYRLGSNANSKADLGRHVRAACGKQAQKTEQSQGYEQTRPARRIVATWHVAIRCVERRKSRLEPADSPGLRSRSSGPGRNALRWAHGRSS
jgi:hypothetical protein